MDDCYTFREELALRYPTLGRALWEPDPGHLRDSVEVGDVGLIRDGYFCRLFNALRPSAASHHPSDSDSSHAPNYPPQLKPRTSDHIRRSIDNRSDFCSKNISKATVSHEHNIYAAGPDGYEHVTFSCSGRQGALISLPFLAQREDTLARADFGKWIVKNIHDCIQVAEDLGWGVDCMEDIILVTGRHLAKSWINGTFTENRRCAQVSFGIRVSGVSGVRLQKRDIQGGELKLGPSGEDLPENQCIFIRGYHVVRIWNIWPRLRAMAEPTHDMHEPEPQSGTPLELIGPPANIDNHDPLRVLLAYLADQAPECGIAFVHDDDLEFIDGAPLETLQPDVFMRYLLENGPAVQKFQCGFSPGNESTAEAKMTKTTVATLSQVLLEEPHESWVISPFLTTSDGASNEDECLAAENDSSDEQPPAIRLDNDPRNLLDLTSAEDPGHPLIINVDRQRRLRELDNNISSLQNVVLLTTRSHPVHALCIQRLAMTHFTRYTLSRQQDDLEQSIFRFTEALCLPLTSDRHTPCLNIVQIFYYLALSIFIRAEESRRSEDVKPCIMYLRYLRLQRHDIPIGLALPVTETLVRALSVQVELELGDVNHDIEEMVDLCDELLNSDISITSLTSPIMAFVRAIDAHHLKGPFERQISSDRVINLLRAAIQVIVFLPDLQRVSIVLTQSLLNRFLVTLSDDDYQEGMNIVDKAISARHPEDRPSSNYNALLELAAIFTLIKFNAYRGPEHLEEAIYRFRALLDVLSFEDPGLSQVVRVLSSLQSCRFNLFGIAGKIRDTKSSHSEPSTLLSFRDLAASLPELNGVKTIPMTIFLRNMDALHPTAIERLTDLTDIEDGIKYCRLLLASYPHNQLAPFACLALGFLCYRAFVCTNKIEYLDDAISDARDQINTADPLAASVSSILTLISFLSSRLELLHRREDLDEIMQLYPIAANHKNTGPVRLFSISCQWASLARRYEHPSTLTAYESAISSMRVSLSFAPTLDVQHSRLVGLGDELKTLPLDSASYQIHTHRPNQAIETLERGRTLLWSEMRGLRTSTDGIGLANPTLADKFAAINRDLETITFAFPPNSDIAGGGSHIEGMDSFGRLMVWRRKLLDDREMLISQIQSLPGFDSFLKPPAFDTLRSAASHGPVIIINHSKWRSDIVILLYDAPPSLIPTSNDFYDRAIKLQDQLTEGRTNAGIGSDHCQDALRSVLWDLYELVGQPVIKRLSELNVPEQSRVWWCPTSVFCSLPLHAMGPIPSEKGSPRYFLDLYISSYTPSLSALIETRKPGSPAIGRPSILLVARPDTLMPEALKEIKAVQTVDAQVTTLFSRKATPTATLTRLRNHRFAHIVCPVTLELGRPFEASFKLHRGERLLLLDIVRSRLPDAEFAFLSGCHTAELTRESIADEVLHLAAAMQFCGFRSVVGTMWAMADIDGPDLARSFYKSVFSDELQGQQRGHYYERTAEALRDAVVKLRSKRGITLERWVNFVHYGA